MPPLLILRHGETVWNRENRLQGSLDSDLTALGQVQAARQGALVRAQGLSDWAVLVSPQARAKRTAALAGLCARSEPHLAELGLGEWEGQVIAPRTGVAWKFKAPQGEGRAAFTARLRALLCDIRRPTILVTHGVVAIGLRALSRGLSDAHWDILEDPQGTVHHVTEGREEIWR